MTGSAAADINTHLLNALNHICMDLVCACAVRLLTNLQLRQLRSDGKIQQQELQVVLWFALATGVAV